MKFSNPEALWLFVPLLIVFSWPLLGKLKAGFKRKFRKSDLYDLPHSEFSNGIKKVTFISASDILNRFLFPIGISLLIVALARPQGSPLPGKSKTEGIDIVLTVDTSTSMNAEDFPGNRFNVAKENLRNFVGERKNDRIGLVAFAGEAMTLCPPTQDYGVLLNQLKMAKTGVLKDGTAIGDALMQSINRLRDSRAKSRVIVLLTDGDNNYGQIDPDSAAEIAKGYGIRVYTIGIGTQGEVPIPTYSTNFLGRKVKTYIRTKARLNMDLLNRISQSTGGRAYRATSPNALSRVMTEINTLEKSEILSQKRIRYKELFVPWLRTGFIILILYCFLAWYPLRRINA